MRRVLLITFAVAAIAVAQNAPPATQQTPAAASPVAQRKAKKQPKNSAAHYLEVTDSLTKEIGDQAGSLTKYERAMLEAQLCNSWWEADEGRARRWCAQAADDVSLIPDNESAAERKQRREAAAEVLSVAGHRDGASRQKIVDALARDLKTNDDARTRAQISDSLSSAGNDSDDDATTLALTREALKFGTNANWILGNLLNISQTYPADAQALFMQALSHATPDFIEGVLNHFPSTGPGSVIPDEWTQPVIDLLSRTPMQQPPDQSRDEWCRWILVTGILADTKDNGAPVAPGLQTPQLATAKKTCGWPQVLVSDDRAPGFGFSNPDGADSTADDLVAQQRQSDPTTQSAAAIAAAEKLAAPPKDDYDGALNLLEGIDADSTLHGIADSTRARIITEAAQAYFKQGDYKNAWRMIDRAPPAAIPSIEIELAGERFRLKLKDASPGKNMVTVSDTDSADLPAARELVRRADLELQQHSPEDPEIFLRLLNVALNRRLFEPEVMLHDVVQSLNRWREKDTNGNQHRAIGDHLAPVSLSYAVSEPGFADEDMVGSALREIENTKTRISFQLALLNSYMDRWRAARNAEKKRSATATSSADNSK
jgi:hypothetical protein